MYQRRQTIAILCLASAHALGVARADTPGPEHWSLQALRTPTPPVTTNPGWGNNPIDAFVAAKLSQQGLEPREEADRHTLIRRATFALTGLPPTPEEVEPFIADAQPGAYRSLVDRLLASPRYGERWARHWLDVARFGESDGILTVNEDKVRPEAWRYRDAAIRAFNADLPWDEFVRYQFVAPPEDQREYAALRQFIHLGTRLQKNADPNDKQFHRLDDMVATTGNAFLAFTFGCARCHDHPVDPMSTEEYYELTAVFFDQVRVEPKASKRAIPLQITEPRVLKAGSWSNPGAQVEAGYLRALMAKPAEHWRSGTGDELAALAAWLTDVEHGAGAQLARVIVNRLWHYHFGRGLVATPNDFGTLGAEPSHPELLDWLASQLIECGWRLKPIQRLIVTSATYRQSGAAAGATAALQKDADNRWLWHRRPARLEAEAVRDSLLAVAGVLKPEMYGKSLSVGAYKKEIADTPEKWRRSIYLTAHRTVRHPTLSLFDPPDRERSEGARAGGSSPGSALFALNSPLVWQLAGSFAKRVQKEAGKSPREQIERAYLIALARPPTEEERAIGLDLLGDGDGDALVRYCHLLLGLNEFIYVH